MQLGRAQGPAICALFWLCTTAAYLRYAARPSAGRCLLVAGLFALGLASKAMIMTLPLALLLLDCWPLGRLRLAGGWRVLRPLLLEKAPLLALSVAMGLVALSAQRATGALGTKGSRAAETDLLICRVFCAEATRRVSRHFRAMDHNHDEELKELSRRACEQGGYPAGLFV